MKSTKTPFFVLFADFRAKKIFSGKPASITIFCFYFSIAVQNFEKKKTMNRIQEKLVTDVEIHRCTNKHEFIGPPLPGVQKQHGRKANYINFLIEYLSTILDKLFWK